MTLFHSFNIFILLVKLSDNYRTMNLIWFDLIWTDVFVAAVPEEFSYDPVSKTYGEPQRRPEIRASTIEFIAPSEYMVSTRYFLTITVYCSSWPCIIFLYHLVFCLLLNINKFSCETFHHNWLWLALAHVFYQTWHTRSTHVHTHTHSCNICNYGIVNVITNSFLLAETSPASSLFISVRCLLQCHWNWWVIYIYIYIYIIYI